MRGRRRESVGQWNAVEEQSQQGMDKFASENAKVIQRQGQRSADDRCVELQCGAEKKIVEEPKCAHYRPRRVGFGYMY